jgi:hypothetical protein
MKKRVFQRMVDSVFEVMIFTEDWSQDDIRLMVQYGEPEVDMGGTVAYWYDPDGSDDGESSDDVRKTVSFGSEYIRILHGMPYVRRFDSRDFGSVRDAKAAGSAWKDMVLNAIDNAVLTLRAKGVSFPTEEVSEI